MTDPTGVLSAAPGGRHSNMTAEGAPRSLNAEPAFKYPSQRAREMRSSMHVLELYLSITGGKEVPVCCGNPEFIAKFGSLSKGLR